MNNEASQFELTYDFDAVVYNTRNNELCFSTVPVDGVNEQLFKIDWLSFSADMPKKCSFMALASDILVFFSNIAGDGRDVEGFCLSEKPGPGLHYSDRTIYIVFRSVLFGYISLMKHQRFNMVLNGTALQYFIQSYSSFLVRYQEFILKFSDLKLHRVDICYDDFLNSLDLYNQALFSYEIKQFGTATQPIKKEYLGSDGGNTLYIGSRSSGKLVRFYYKGVQLDSKEFPNWLRVEIEFTAASRFIPLDILSNPGSYFVGAYPLFFSQFFGNEYGHGTAIPYNSVDFRKLDVSRAIEVLKKQYGAYIYALVDIMGVDEFVNAVSLPHPKTFNGYPPRLSLIEKGFNYVD